MPRKSTIMIIHLTYCAQFSSLVRVTSLFTFSAALSRVPKPWSAQSANIPTMLATYFLCSAGTIALCTLIHQRGKILSPVPFGIYPDLSALYFTSCASSISLRRPG